MQRISPQNAQDMAALRAIDCAEQMIERYIGCMDENNLFLRSASKLICMVTPQSDAELERIAAALQVARRAGIPFKPCYRDR